MRVLLFAVPAAPRGMPIAWNGHWYGRAGESLTALPITKLDAIRAQAGVTDWTAQIVDEVRPCHLEDKAVSWHGNHLPRSTPTASNRLK